MPSNVFTIQRGTGGDIRIVTENEDAAQILWGWADGGDGHRLYGHGCGDGGWRWCWFLDDLTVMRFLMDLRQQMRTPFRFGTKRSEIPFIYELLGKLDAL